MFSCSLTHPSLARVNIMALPDYIDEDNLQKQGVEVKRVLWPDLHGGRSKDLVKPTTM